MKQKRRMCYIYYIYKDKAQWYMNVIGCGKMENI